jgi:Fe2+ transport system protein FeoA
VNEQPPCATPVAGQCAQPLLCPLNRVRAGTAVRIKHLSAPPELTHRLREMGFCEEQKIRLLSQQTNVICQVCNARFGISAQLAETILVEPLPARPDGAEICLVSASR